MSRHARSHADSFAVEVLERRSLMAADLVPGGILMLPDTNQGVRTISRAFVFSVVNMGDEAAPAGVEVAFYLSRNGTLHGTDRLVRRSRLPDSIAPGDRVTFTKVTRIPREMDDGQYQIICVVDPDNAIPESDETNNTLPSDAFTVSLPPQIGSITINKLYLRPGSQATLTAHDVSNLDPGTAEVWFYQQRGPLSPLLPLDSQHAVLLGSGTRVGNDFVLAFTADASWLNTSNVLFAETRKSASRDAKGLQIEGRRLDAPTIGSFSFIPPVRGQWCTFTAAGVSADTQVIQWYFDSNFNGRYDAPGNGLHPGGDLLLGGCKGPTWSWSFLVPDWFPSAPTTVFVVAVRVNTGTTRVYSTLLSAHD